MIITDPVTIIDFLEGKGTDYKGRTFHDILSCDDRVFEGCHDQIQQIFPLHEESRHAETYPVLTPATVKLAKGNKLILLNMTSAFVRFERFLAIGGPQGENEDPDIQRKWCKYRNHNLLRITRAIRSLRFFELDVLSEILYKDAMKVADRLGLDDFPKNKWRQALRDDIWATLLD